MKKVLLFLIALLVILPFLTQSQEAQNTKRAFPSRINGGFYIKLGPVFPIGTFSAGQTVTDYSKTPPLIPYYPARMGAGMDLGFLIYLGPAFANNHLRAGIDATFLNVWFNPGKPDVPITKSKYNYWYYFLSQKFGPVITINPIDRLMIDLSYKINAIGGWYNSEYGKNLFMSEVSMNIRYSIMLFSFQYNFGNITYDNYESSNPDHVVDVSTFRVLIGLKF